MFEEQRLYHYSASLQHNADLPLRPPSFPACSQGLQLSTNGDVLIGRADNGMTRACCHQAADIVMLAPRNYGSVQ